jgi:glycosyltransferase involved in cell wall biosynthesis
MDAPLDASVVVPAFDSATTIEATLAALSAQDGALRYEVIVVDDGSSDATPEIVARAGPPARLLRQPRSGPAAARNRGVEAARGRALAFTDADCVPEPGWLRAGIAALRDADLVQGKVLPDPAAARAPFDRTITIRREYGLYEAANLFVTRELFERLGGFEDWLEARIGKPLAEDVWFGWRARRAGTRTAFCDEALVHHAVFDRSALEYVAERLRLVYFPAMVGRMPELRRAFLYRRWFLTRRAAALDLAIAGALAGLCSSRRTTRLAAAIAAAPYLRDLLVGARRGGRRLPAVAAVDVAADAVGLGALLAGSIRFRRPVL